MKVLLVNGSPHKNGSTDRALQEVAKTLEAGGVETEIFWIGTAPIGGCIGCGGCGKKGECVFGGPVVEFVRKAKTADGFVFGSPVHYAAASGDIHDANSQPIIGCANVPPPLPCLEAIPIAFVFSIHSFGVKVNEAVFFFSKSSM